ncbi:hypothetical protein HYV79_00615, partial [Candidatus Woesearchaeota archaeon]|nr:hypothetical protein [Candidatus Woesearchaeota archaeon]
MSEHLIPPQSLDELARKFGLGKYAPLPKDNVNSTTTKPATKTSNTRNFSIEEREDSYVLHSVEYADEVCDFTWTKELLDGGNTHTQ